MAADDIARQLRDLKELHAEGTLTDAEYAAAKKSLIGQGYESPGVPSPGGGPPPPTAKKMPAWRVILVTLVVFSSIFLVVIYVGSTRDAGGNNEQDGGSGYLIETSGCNQDAFLKSYSGTIKNTSNDEQTYVINVEFLSQGVRVDEGLAIVNSLAPGQTATWEAVGFGDQKADRCAVRDVSVFPW